MSDAIDIMSETLVTLTADIVSDDSDPYYPSYFEGRKESACYMEYFESILENLHAFSEMDVYFSSLKFLKLLYMV